MSWRLAKALVVLRTQINGNFPGRAKVSDGTVGDLAHANRKSDHNPRRGVVHAMDITHDPSHGLDSRRVAQAILNSRDKRVDNIISNGEIAAGAEGPKPWVWRAYKGKNPHNHHFHISVLDKHADDESLWHVGPTAINAVVPEVSNPTPAPHPEQIVLVMGTKGAAVERLQELLNKHGAKLVLDADFGPATHRAVIAFQRKRKLVPDGKAGTATWMALRG